MAAERRPVTLLSDGYIVVNEDVAAALDTAQGGRIEDSLANTRRIQAWKLLSLIENFS